MQGSMRVGTWNIGSLYADLERNYGYLQEVLTERSTDILCLQELPKKGELLENICRWGGFSHYTFHTTSQSHVCTDNEMGIGIFSRYALQTLDILRLTKPTVEIFYKGRQEFWHDKYFMAVSCDVEDGPVLIVTGHGFPFHRYDLENAASSHIITPSLLELDEWLMELPERFGLPVLCAAADFNITDPLPFMPKSAACYRDVFHGEATRPFGRKTDAILIDGNVNAKSKRNIRSPLYEDEREIFDHHFIIATLDMTREKG